MEKNGSTFLMALGFFLVAVSPLWGNKYLNIITGLTLVGCGYYFFEKEKIILMIDR